VIRSFAQNLQTAATVLDIGCGNGSPITSTLLKLGLSPYGIDSSIKMVNDFRKKLPGVSVQHSDVLNSDFFNRSFDAIVGYGFMFHLSPAQQNLLLKKVAHHLEPGGYLLFNSGDEDGSKLPAPECNGGERIMMYSMSCANYETTLQRNGLALTSNYIEEEFGSTIYIAQKTAT